MKRLFLWFITTILLLSATNALGCNCSGYDNNIISQEIFELTDGSTFFVCGKKDKENPKYWSEYEVAGCMDNKKTTSIMGGPNTSIYLKNDELLLEKHIRGANIVKGEWSEEDMIIAIEREMLFTYNGSHGITEAEHKLLIDEMNIALKNELFDNIKAKKQLSTDTNENYKIYINRLAYFSMLGSSQAINMLIEIDDYLEGNMNEEVKEYQQEKLILVREILNDPSIPVTESEIKKF